LLIVIDNYDSFTYNLVQYLGELGAEFPVAASEFYNTKSHWADQALAARWVVISQDRSPRRCRNFLDLIQHMGSNLQF